MYGTKRLGEWLIQQGKITPAQLQEPVENRRVPGMRLCETRIEL